MSCPPVGRAAPIFALRRGAVDGAKAASIVCVRLALLNGSAAAPASDLSSVRQVAPVFTLRMGAVEDTEGDRQQA